MVGQMGSISILPSFLSGASNPTGDAHFHKQLWMQLHSQAAVEEFEKVRLRKEFIVSDFIAKP